MKKTFFIVLTAAAIVGCSNEEVIIEQQGGAITFGEVFVDNATRAATDPSYNSQKFVDAFKVWGTVQGNTNNTINLFNGADVTRGGVAYGAAFTCAQKEYWIPSATYNFAAVAHATTVGVSGGLPSTINFTQGDGSADLIYAGPVEITTDAVAVPAGVNNSNGCVAFTFKHLLSKTEFLFENTVDNVNYTYQVTGISISNLYSEGIYTVSDAEWAASGQDASNKVLFGDAANAIAANGTATSAKACLIIPANYDESETTKFNVNFTATLLYNGTSINTVKHEIPVAYTFEAGHAYKFNVSLGVGNEIKFTITKVSTWTPEGGSTDVTL